MSNSIFQEVEASGDEKCMSQPEKWWELVPPHKYRHTIQHSPLMAVKGIPVQRPVQPEGHQPVTTPHRAADNQESSEDSAELPIEPSYYGRYRLHRLHQKVITSDSSLVATSSFRAPGLSQIDVVDPEKNPVEVETRMGPVSGPTWSRASNGWRLR